MKLLKTIIISLFFSILFVCVGQSRAADHITLASRLSNPNFLTVDQNNVYWTETTGTAGVKKVGLNGGMATTLAVVSVGSGGSGGTDITVDGISVYWGVNPGYGSGNIYKNSDLRWHYNYLSFR